MRIILGFLFMMFTTNCSTGSTGINSLEENSIPLTSNAKSINYWSTDPKIIEIQKLIHNNYDNDKFEVIRQPIRIDKLTEIVLSFINGKESEAYIIIGLEEFLYHYRNMSESTFNALPTKEDGIYRINDHNNIVKYYQVIDEKITKIIEYNSSFIRKELSNIKDETNLTFRECNNMFIDIIKQIKPVDSNNITVINNPIKVNIDTNSKKLHRIVTFNDNKAYIQNLKKYIRSHTNPKIEFDDPYIKDIYIKPDGINEIIILKIKPHEMSPVQHKTTGIYYDRSKNGYLKLIL